MLGHQFEGDEPSLRDIELCGSPYEPPTRSANG